jgi:SAM-dependent methyltransferase
VSDAYLQPYRDAQQTHGASFDVTMWARPETQQLRFRVFTEMLDFTGRRVLDAGCSRGDFAAYLIDAGIEYGRFIGIDGLPEVIDFARQRGLRESRFEAGDFVSEPGWLATESPQIVTISGSLNTMDLSTVLSVLEGAWAGGPQTLLFNFLSDRIGSDAPPQEYPAKRQPTLRLLEWALEQTPSVRLRQDYFPQGHDATILMQRE